MCLSPKWGQTLSQLGLAAHVNIENDGGVQELRDLWSKTVSSRSSKPGEGGIVVRKGSGTHGRAGPAYGVCVWIDNAGGSGAFGTALMVLLHELCHMVQGPIPVIDGVRRPHDITFNRIMCRMATIFFGYDKTPEDSGFHVRRGYQPSWALADWMGERFENGDPLISSWTYPAQRLVMV